MNSIQLREKRAALVNEMNHIVAAAQTEGRSLNAEENQKFDAIENDVRSLGESAEKIERAEQMKKEIAAGREARAEQKEITKREAFSKYLRHGLAGLNMLSRLDQVAGVAGSTTVRLALAADRCPKCLPA